MEQEIFNPGDKIQMACLRFCFAQLLQDDLDKDELFLLPELHGGETGLLHPVLDDEIQSIREKLTYEEEKSIYQEYFEYVLDNTVLQLPNSFEEGLSLYKQLLETVNIR